MPSASEGYPRRCTSLARSWNRGRRGYRTYRQVLGWPPASFFEDILLAIGAFNLQDIRESDIDAGLNKISDDRPTSRRSRRGHGRGSRRHPEHVLRKDNLGGQQRRELRVWGFSKQRKKIAASAKRAAVSFVGAGLWPLRAWTPVVHIHVLCMP